MKTLRLIILGFLLASTSVSFAQISTEEPMPGEEFQSFFARITRGGGFPGIFVTPPLSVQESFLKTIRVGYWVGRKDEVTKALKQHNVDLWGDWYKNDHSFPAILNSAQKKEQFAKILNQRLQQDHAQCDPKCPTAEAILGQRWKDLETFSRQEFTLAFVLDNPAFGGKTLLQHLADQYRFPVATVLASTKIQILSNEKFEAAVRKVGYQGPIYFRGITAPDPENPQGHVVILNDEYILGRSPFQSALLQTLELPGILTHELSHVFQDLKGRELGYDVQVRSAEGALMIEGAAETLAEAAMTEAALNEQAPSALGLFVAEQAVEIVTREGNGSSGRLFPYTVGLPFVTAIYNHQDSQKRQALTEEILSFLGGTQPLQEWLKKF